HTVGQSSENRRRLLAIERQCFFGTEPLPPTNFVRDAGEGHAHPSLGKKADRACRGHETDFGGVSVEHFKASALLITEVILDIIAKIAAANQLKSGVDEVFVRHSIRLGGTRIPRLL